MRSKIMLGKLDIENRTSKMKKNIFFSFLIRFFGVFINLLYVPFTISYINTERYGIWLTISSFIGWMGLLDVGFGNGLRNKYAEAIAKNDIESERKIVHTTLFVLILISIIISTTGILLSNYINWDQILGVSLKYRLELQKLFLYIAIIFSLQFVFQIINPIFYALQKSSLVSLISLSGNLTGLLGIILLKLYFTPSLFLLGIIITTGNTLSFFLFFLYYFAIARKDLLSEIKKPDIKYIKSIFSLGVKFFVINVAYVIQYQSANFLISRYFTSEKVTEFNIAFKLFSVGSIYFSIIISPVWSTVTNAYMNNDYTWIESLIKKLLLLWLSVFAGCTLAFFYADQIYKIWIGNDIYIPKMISLGAALIICTNCFSSIFIQMLNGLSIVNLQFWISFIVIVIFIPLAYFFSIFLAWGVFGICFAIVLSNVNGLIVAPIQLRKVILRMKNKINH